ncbi:MAG: transposase [Ramlibacter sp.]|nr:transposase [Ramlibacter sp.]
MPAAPGAHRSAAGGDVRRGAAQRARGHGADEACDRLRRGGRRIYSRRIATVEPVFANLRHNKRLDRFTLRGKEKVGTQWRLYCMVHNIEKLARNGYRDERS